jgi:hypothetical protein
MAGARVVSHLDYPDVTQLIFCFLSPFHPAAACSRALRDALAEQAAALMLKLAKLECSIAPSFAPQILGRPRLLSFTVRRQTMDQAAKAICPEGCCGSQPCERTETLCKPCDASWLEDVDWACVAPRGPRKGALKAALDELVAADLPARVVEHSHFEARKDKGEHRAMETHDVHVFLPLGRRALEFAYTVEYER